MKNEPAFPSTLQYFPRDTSYHDNEGMSLRDYFAARAMQSTFYPAILESIRIDKDLNCGSIARYAYTMADAMMAERSKP